MARERSVVIVGAKNLGRKAFIVKNPRVVVIIVNLRRFSKSLREGASTGKLPPPPDNCVYLYDSNGIAVGLACPFGRHTGATRAELNRLIHKYLKLAGEGYCDCETVNGTTRCTCYY